jgi:5-methylcytosine-specific restriction endonuclease McrA
VTVEDWGRGDRRRLSLRDYPPAVLELVDRKQGGRYCVLCHAQGLVTPDDEPLVVDHLQPLSHGGDNHHSNLRWLCRSHNSRRGAKAGFAGEPAWAIRRKGRTP